MNGLTIIGERINPGFKSTRGFFDARDVESLGKLAAEQQSKGAKYLNINLGGLAASEPDFFRAVLDEVQRKSDLPLSIDYPDLEVQQFAFRHYRRSDRPIVNSVSELRYKMLEVLKNRPAKILLMASEREVGGEKVANRTAGEVHATARRLVERVLNTDARLTADDLFIDVSVCPIAADMEGLIPMAVDAIKLIGADPFLKGVHMSVGLSNLSIMMPARTRDGLPLKELLESAFLTNTVPFGLDTVIGTAGRDYRLLEPGNPVLVGFNEAIRLSDVEALMRIQELYQ
ncbi:MAG: dihydropteroate synthase [Victivallaceae bacterium]|nr:dihydropteroate synthase [Victivallaceae bacterium]